MAEILVDVSELEAPFPLTTIARATTSLEVGDYIKMVHRMEPCVLYERLEADGFYYRVIKKRDEVNIYICKKTDALNIGIIKEK